jgi:hypothetical protein
MSPNRFILTGENEPWIIELGGTNLLPESELSLRPVAGGDAVLPAEYTAFPDGKGGRAVFNSADLAAGRYELRVRNPGGFETSGECTVKNRLSFDLFVSTSYAPALPFYGYLSDLFDNQMYPLGFSLRADFLPLKRNWGSLGLEALASWNYLSVTKTGLTGSGNFFLSHLNLLYQYTLFPQLVLGIRLGGGQTTVIDLSHKLDGVQQDPVSTWMLSMDGGVSLKWIFHPQGFAELGLDYVNLFSASGPQGLLFPFVGVGWKY